MFIIVLISVTYTILSATTTEVTIKGLVSLTLAVLALTLGVRLRSQSAHSVQVNPVFGRRGLLEPKSSRRVRRSMSMRLLVGSIVSGIILAIVTATIIAMVLGRVLERLT